VTAARLLAVAALTVPDCVPHVPDDDHMPYEPLRGRVRASDRAPQPDPVVYTWDIRYL
jgi:hypothetical protein